MAYNQGIADSFQYSPVPVQKRSLLEMLIQAQQAGNQNQAAVDTSRAAGQTFDYNAKTASDRARQVTGNADQTELDNRGLRATLPVKTLEGQQAGVESNYLEQMFPGATRSAQPAGPPMSRESDAPTLPPQVANQFAGKSLSELRQMKADAGPTGEFLGRFIDPMIKVRSDTEELAPALTEISTIAEMPGGTREEARTKGAALSAVLAKYPQIAGDARLKEAISTATPRNPDVTMDPFRAMGAERQAVQQVIGLENQLRDEYEKASGDSRIISRAGQDIAAALKTNNPLSIRTAVTKFSKIADPTTGVLGGEASATEQAAMGDLINRIQGSAEKLASGTMTPETKKNFEAATRDLMRIQKSIFQRVQERSKSRFDSYKTRFPDLNLSLDAVMGTEGDRTKEISQFDAFPNEAPTAKVVKNKAEYDALPSGSEYIGPSGKKARKP